VTEQTTDMIRKRHEDSDDLQSAATLHNDVDDLLCKLDQSKEAVREWMKACDTKEQRCHDLQYRLDHFRNELLELAYGDDALSTGEVITEIITIVQRLDAPVVEVPVSECERLGRHVCGPTPVVERQKTK